MRRALCGAQLCDGDAWCGAAIVRGSIVLESVKGKATGTCVAAAPQFVFASRGAVCQYPAHVGRRRATVATETAPDERQWSRPEACWPGTHNSGACDLAVRQPRHSTNFAVRFRVEPRRRRRPRPVPTEPPRIVRLMGLADEWQHMLDAGIVRNRAELAKRAGVSAMWVDARPGAVEAPPGDPGVGAGAAAGDAGEVCDGAGPEELGEAASRVAGRCRAAPLALRVAGARPWVPCSCKC